MASKAQNVPCPLGLFICFSFSFSIFCKPFKIVLPTFVTCFNKLSRLIISIILDKRTNFIGSPNHVLKRRYAPSISNLSL